MINVFAVFTGKLLQTLQNSNFHKTCYLDENTRRLGRRTRRIGRTTRRIGRRRKGRRRDLRGRFASCKSEKRGVKLWLQKSQHTSNILRWGMLNWFQRDNVSSRLILHRLATTNLLL